MQRVVLEVVLLGALIFFHLLCTKIGGASVRKYCWRVGRSWVYAAAWGVDMVEQGHGCVLTALFSQPSCVLLLWTTSFTALDVISATNAVATFSSVAAEKDLLCLWRIRT